MTAGQLQQIHRDDATRPEHGFRPDVEGMRAVAVGLVLLYHAGLPFLPGGFVGVDVFFVISGFLITGMLVREVERHGRVSLRRFYARRAKRLLPAAALVLVVVAVLTRLVMSVVDWRVYGGDIVAAAIYVVNWRFADRSVDYLAEDVGASPVQHFWSLAVEEQFYIIWPLLLVLVAWWVRRSGWSVRKSMGVALAVIAVPSLAWSMVMTAAEPERAFFVSTTRLWELAVGAAVAIAAPGLGKLAPSVAAMLAWAGLSAVVVAGFVVTTATPWPGYAALLPTLGTAAVIGAGVAAGSRGPIMLLGRAPLLWTGALSYSLYLWHWPLIVLATAHWGELSTARGLAVVAVSFVPAWLAYRLVENPARHAPAMSRSRNALTMGVVLSAVGALAGFGLVASTPSTPSTAVAGSAEARGAQVLAADPDGDPVGAPVDTVDAMIPSPADATSDVPDAYAQGCQVSFEETEPLACHFGDPDGDVTVALVGDSKAVQWMSALDTLARERGWKVVTYAKSSCPFADVSITRESRIFDECDDWNRAALDAILADLPDVVLTSQGSRSALNDPADPSAGQSPEAMAEGLASRWEGLEQAGVDVVVLSDNPHPGMQVYECVAENLHLLTACTFSREAGLEKSAALTLKAAADQSPDVDLVDLTTAVCPTPTCAPVIGGVLVYRQGSHITRTYVDSMLPRLDAALTPLIDR